MACWERSVEALAREPLLHPINTPEGACALGAAIFFIMNANLPHQRA